MPRSETDIPHFTFTHHRIGIAHSSRRQEAQTVELIPFGETNRLAAIDLERCLGLALQRAGEKMESPLREIAHRQSFEHLQNVYQQGLRDADVLGGLSYFYWSQGDPKCLELAEQALSDPDCSNETRVESLIVIGDTQLKRGRFPEAEEAFTQLTRLRLRYTDWQMLGVCRSLQHQGNEAVAAFQKALDLKPGSSDLHMLIADELEKLGETQKAADHRTTASRLQKLKHRTD